MYVLVLTRKKRAALFITFIAVLIFLALFHLIQVLTPGFDITLMNRFSMKVPASVEVSSIFTTYPDQPYVQVGSVFGQKLKTETIKRQGLSEISFQYPETLRMDEIQNLGEEVTIHINFKHSDNKMAGFFQVWTLNQSLEELLDRSKKMSSMTFTEFNESKLKVQGMDGILWEYVFITATSDIKGVEIFIENGTEMYRFSMFALKDDYKHEYKKIITKMAKSLKIKEMLSITEPF